MLDILLLEQVNWMLAFQAIAGGLAGAAEAITRLGDEEFFLFVAPVIYWSFSTTIGLRVGLYLMISGGLNYALKLFFAQPRPYWIDPQILAFRTESSFGLPSGHAQHATVFWGALAASSRQPAILILVMLIIFLIGVSRVLLGVHFISDVLAGWLIGALLLWLLILLEKPALQWLKRQTFTKQIVTVFVGSLILLGIGFIARVLNADWQMPAEWLANATSNPSGGDPPDPMAMSGLITNAGALFGLAAGSLWINRHGGFSPRGLAWKRLVRFILGVIGVAVLWFGLGAVFPRGESLLPYILRYIRYALVGLWVTGLAPWLFIQLHLAEQDIPSINNTPGQ